MVRVSGTLLYGTTFFTARQGVGLGIFELTAQAEPSGAIGAMAGVTASGGGFGGNVTPFTALDANASVILDIVVASAGVVAQPARHPDAHRGRGRRRRLGPDGQRRHRGPRMLHRGLRRGHGHRRLGVIAERDGITVLDRTLFADGGQP